MDEQWTILEMKESTAYWKRLAAHASDFKAAKQAFAHMLYSVWREWNELQGGVLATVAIECESGWQAA